MKYEKGSFITVPNTEMLSSLPSQAQTLFMWLCFYANQEGTCFPSRSTLAKKCGWNKSNTVDKWIKVLIQAEIIEKDKRFNKNEQLSNNYSIIIGGVAPANGLGSPRKRTTPQPPQTDTELNLSSLTKYNELENLQKKIVPVCENSIGLEDEISMGISTTPSPAADKTPDIITEKLTKSDLEAIELKDYFSEQGKEKHRLRFFVIKKSKREKKILNIIKNVKESIPDLDCKGLIDWWFKGNGKWAGFDPELCFRENTIERFINDGKGDVGVEEEKNKRIEDLLVSMNK